MNTNTSTQPVSQMSIRPAPSPTRMEHMEKILTIGGRALVALLFILAGMAKILNPTPFLEHMAQLRRTHISPAGGDRPGTRCWPGYIDWLAPS